MAGRRYGNVTKMSKEAELSSEFTVPGSPFRVPGSGFRVKKLKRPPVPLSSNSKFQIQPEARALPASSGQRSKVCAWASLVSYVKERSGRAAPRVLTPAKVCPGKRSCNDFGKHIS